MHAQIVAAAASRIRRGVTSRPIVDSRNLIGVGAASVVAAITLLGAPAARPQHLARTDAPPTQVAFESDRTGNADVVVATGGNEGRTVTTAPTEEIQPALSPDGRLAFASDRSGNFDVYVTTGGASSDRIQLTQNPSADYAPAWAPGSGWIAFVSERRGNADVFVIESAESGVARAVTTSRADDRDPAWSLRGISLAYSSDRAGSYDIWIVGLGRKARRFTRGSPADFEPAWAPDGRRLAFTRRDRHGNYDIYSLTLPGGRVRRLTDDPGEDSEASWSRDGKQIAFTSNRDGDYDIYVMDADGGREENLSNNAAFFDISPSWRPRDETTTAPPSPFSAHPFRARMSGADEVPVTCDEELTGGPGDDTLRGDPDNDDVICGKGGNDTIYGFGGNDILIGGSGRDRLFGGAGKDRFNIRDGQRDSIRGGPGIDRARTDGRRLDAKISVEGPL